MNDSLAMLDAALRAPGPETRSAPFWAWNDRLQPQELCRQIDGMQRAGIGGFFIHSREGLETPYLSDEWMDDVAVSVAQAKRRGMEVWIYDEDKWPSGSAGGLVSAADPDAYTAKGLTLEVLADAAGRDLTVGKKQADGTVLAVYAAQTEGSRCRGLRLLACGEAAPQGMATLVLRREVSGPSEWYNGLAPADNLNPAAVRTFLRLTHERYKARFGAEFGRTIRGFFTDEPDVYDFYLAFSPGRPYLPWTDGLPEYFAQRRGYNPLPLLPLLFFTGEGSERIRHDFWRTISDRFSESYMKQLYDWCAENGVLSTGHMLYENDLGYNARVCGAAMPQYRYLHAPGIDLLGEQTQEYLTVKQCTSVAAQYGRAMTITETYGCTGWAFSFAGQKWLADWQFVMGITRRCQHLALYSITGCRKRDYPPVFNYQTTWWNDDRLLEDYYARLNTCLTTGTAVRELLVIHPMSSIWTQCGSDPHEDLTNIEMNMGWKDEHIVALNRWGEEYNRMAHLLLAAHRDFDFGDETILSENAAAENGLLRVGGCRYRGVIVPRVLSLFASTAALLEAFARQGGRIWWVGALPALCEGVPAPAQTARLAALPGLCRVADYDALPAALEAALPPFFRVRGETGEDGSLLTMLRRTADGYLLFAVNTDRQAAHAVQIEVRAAAAVTAYDALHDTRTELAAALSPDGAQETFFSAFAPAESRVFFLETGRAPRRGSAAFPYRHPHAAAPVFCALGPEAPFTRTLPNVLTLDTCRWQLAGGAWSAEMPVWQAQRQMRAALHMQQVYYNGAPQRYTWLCRPCPADGTPFALQFSFTVDEGPENVYAVAVEKPAGLTVRVNGADCPAEEGYLLDRDFRLFRAAGVQTGVNQLTLSGACRQACELEDLYLTGGFGVSAQRTILREPAALHFGDWCLQGYPHYPGSMIYHFHVPQAPAGQPVFLSFGRWAATLLKVRVNGADAGFVIGSIPPQLEIGALLTQADNALDVEAVGSPRNMFGPFHQTYTGCSRISWADFRTEGRFYTPAYVLEPYGLYGQITLSLAAD